MKFNTTSKYMFVADYYSYKTVSTAGGGVASKVYETVPKKITLSMTSNLELGGATTVTGTDLGSVFASSDTRMQLEGVIRNILDSKGTPMYEGGEWRITMSAPKIGPNGVLNGYKYRLLQVAGNI
jgi:hypothetical protein